MVAYGAVDELNAAVGTGAALCGDEAIQALCRDLQGTLFDLGAYLATPDAERRRKSRIPEIEPDEITALEGHIDAFESELEPLRSFVLPGGSPGAAAFHLARTICRRAERILVALDRDDPLDPAALGYVNRLSDLLFTLARVANHRAGIADVEWSGRG